MADDKKLTAEEVAGIVECEGLGYAIYGYLDAERIEDPDLRRLWSIANGAMSRVMEILKPHLDDW